ncbi:DEAD/DEAH box helicase [Actinomadura formosensis]|uniref:DEAD/DEAH box helicase n=1 Tax=Actinomadura formosensis TaxID=60706 RepID=UPI00082EE986|nr:helicase-related protein [Actinomadura formosensis]
MHPYDLRYEPQEAGYAWMAELQPRTCLVIGDTLAGRRDEVLALAGEIREIGTSRYLDSLHRGGYAFRQGSDWHALILVEGPDPVRAESSRRRSTDDDSHLMRAFYTRTMEWEDATPFAGNSKFSAGDMVRARDSGLIGQVKGVSAVLGSYEYDVEIRGVVKQISEQLLTRVEGDPGDPAFWLTQPPADAAGIGLTLTWTKLRHPLTDTLYSFASSKTVFRTYQFKPVLKLLNGSSGRLLIADEVGLGKTIEAGLIWIELEQRLRLERVLIVTPASLTLKWQAEMTRRFDRAVEILSPAQLEAFADRIERGEDPPLKGIISLESLRTADSVLQRLTEVHPRFDLVIVDEAHSMRNRESKSHALGRLLADAADYLLLLSATPLNLGNDDLFNLMSLLDEQNFGDRLVFERQLEPNQVLNSVAQSLLDTGRRQPRKLLTELNSLHSTQFGAAITDRPDYGLLRELLGVERPLNHEEVARARRLLTDLNMLSGVLTRTRKAEVPNGKAVREPRAIEVDWTNEERAYYDALYAWYMRRAREMGTPPGFAMQMPLRLAASCIPASQRALHEKHPDIFRQEIDDFDDAGDEVLDGLEQLQSLVTPVTRDTKYDRLLTELHRVRAAGLRQVMIFSFFRGTLAYLEERLSEHFSVRVMHGLVSPSAREEIMKDFRAGKFDLLLLSEVGSEGLDFEFCNVLVNYDLPWNPMRVEQRIGRVDRFGQQHEKIFVYNIQVPGTIETDIFQRLYDRIGVFTGSVGALEPILRDEFGDIHKRILDPRLDAAGRNREVERISVALEQRTHDAEALRASEANLSGIDNLLIEGLNEDGPTNGRFIGRAEIRRLLDELFQRYGGRLRGPNRQGVFELIGSRELGTRLRHSQIDRDGSRHTLSKLVTLLYDSTPVPCAFEPAMAAREPMELLSARHPLVKLALEVLGEEDLALPRFGSVTVPGIQDGRRYLVKIDLAETSGLRPLVELWATAIDLETLEEDPAVGDLLLTALAEGTLGDGPSEPPASLRQAWQRAREQASARRMLTERSRIQENTALVEGRIRAREGSLDIQMRKTEDMTERLRADGRDHSIIRLHQGRIRNLREQRLHIRGELARHLNLGVTLSPVAAVLIAPAGHTPSPDTRR